MSRSYITAIEVFIIIVLVVLAGVWYFSTPSSVENAPSVSPVALAAETPTVTPMEVMVTPSAEPKAAVKSATPTPAVAPKATATPSPTPTATPVPTATPKPTPTPSPTPAAVTVGGATMSGSATIFSNISAANNLTTFVSALKAAGLDTTLQGSGPFTVFVPDDAAFNKFPPGTVSSYMQPSNKGDLTDILNFHIVAGKYTTKDLTDGQTLMTLEGDPIRINKGLDSIQVNGQALVKIPDVGSSNGVFYVIDTALIPPQ